MASRREIIGALDSLIRSIRRHDQAGAIRGGSIFGNAEEVLASAKAGDIREVPWTPFIETQARGMVVSFGGVPTVFVNSRYQVLLHHLAPPLVYLSIKRHDQAAVRSWRDLQRIKNELVGPECEAVEIFPAESRKHDSANQMHLWVVGDPTLRFDLGDHTGRKVEGPGPGDFHGQEEFEEGDPHGPDGRS